MGKQLCMGSSQPRLHFDHGSEALFEILKGNIDEWACYPQRIFVPMKPPILAIVGYPPESRCRSTQLGVGLASSASRLPWRAVQPLL